MRGAGPEDPRPLGHVKGSFALRRAAFATVTASLVLAPAAMAQAPIPPAPPAPTPPPPPPPLKTAVIRVGVEGLRYQSRTYVVAHTRLRVVGHMNPAAAGDTVTIDLLYKGKRVKRTHTIVGKRGNFLAHLRAKRGGNYALQALHAQGAAVSAGKSKHAPFTAIDGSYSVGSSGVEVRLIQRQLARLAYVTPRSGSYDDATGRAVLAYRKVNRMSRTTGVSFTILQRLFEYRGSFKLRYPNAGKHVEADLSRQVIVLADHGVPERIYHTSSGKPSTPTVVGSFRFYRKSAGYNAKQMYFSSYFVGGYAIHGYHDVPTYNASHGCLRVPLANAVAIYDWISLGDRIFVYQKGNGSTRVLPNAGP
jgi:peptidoglycan hydrolase-like protein with peptidoglycan-binding domain